MRLRFLKLFLCATCFFSVSAQSEENGDPNDQEGYSSIIDLQGHPSGVVGGMVNIITGHLVDGDIDSVGVGPKPITIQRSYNSGSSQKGTLYDGWDLNLHQDIIVSKDEKHTYAVVSDQGSQFLFKTGSSGHNFKIDEKLLKWGVTNGTQGVFSGRANITNRSISSHFGEKNAYMKMETGEKVYFHRKKEVSENVFWYVATHSCFLDGSTFNYKYGSHKRPSSITSKGRSQTLLDKISFTYLGDHQKPSVWKLQTHTGESVEYHFQKMDSKRGGHHRYMLAEVKRSNAPDLKFEYGPNLSKSKGIERLVEKQWPEGRFRKMEYYESGKTTNDIYISSKKDSRVGRVSALYAPVGVDNTPVATHEFFYFLKEDKKSKRPIGGKTEVVDALGNKKVYHFSSEHRLTSIEEFDSSKALYRRERFFWGSKGSGNYTCLLTRVLEDGVGEVQMYRGWSYDKRGNIVKEIVAGNLTGKETILPQMDRHGRLIENGCEKHESRFSYTGNNLLAEENDGEVVVSYLYRKGTDKIQLQLLSHNNQIKERTYYEYDANGVLVKEIVDDGDSKKITDLAGMTERRIRKITPTTTAPIGLPEVEEEFYYDLEQGIEILVKKSINQYSKKGQLIERKIYDAQGEFAFSQCYSYDNHGNVIRETDPTGIETARCFDQNDLLVEETRDGLQKRFDYDFSNRLISQTELHDDGFQSKVSSTYDLRGNKLSETDRFGNEKKFKHDAFGRLLELTYPSIDGACPTEIYSYDIFNNCVECTDANEEKTRTAYTLRAEPYQIESPDGSCESFKYHPNGTLEENVDKLGVTSRFYYDYKRRKIREEKISPQGELLCFATWKYNAFHLLKESDFEENITYYAYDGAGRLIKEEKGNATTHISYDALERPSEKLEKTHSGTYRKSICEYDVLDRMVEERVEEEDGTLRKRVCYTYDSRGNRTSVSIHSDQGISCTSTCYNTRNQPIEITTPDGFQTHFFYPENYLNTQGSEVECIEEIDPHGVIKRTVMDPLSRSSLVEILSPLGDHLHITAFSYDGVDNLLQRKEEIFAGGHHLKTVSCCFEYDSMGRQTKIIEAFETPEQKSTGKEYTATGQISRQIKPDGVALEYSYNYLGYLARIRSSDGSVDYQYTYDKNGNLLSSNDANNNCPFTRTVDEKGNMTSENLGNGIHLKYSYDPLDRLERMTLPDESTIEYAYDALRLRSVERKGSCGNHKIEFSCCLSGRVKEISLPDQLGCVQFEYDQALRPIKISSPYWSQHVPKGGYDERGNLTKVTYHDCVGICTSNYRYDLLNQLIEESGSINHHYGFDSAHNRTEKDSVTYTNNALNQLVKEGDESYDYDANGNFVSTSRSPAECKYDAFDRLASLEYGKERTEYSYDALHRRRKKITKSKSGQGWVVVKTETFLYNGEMEVGVVDEDGALSQLRVLGTGYGKDVGAACLLEISGRCFVPLHDYRGSVVTLVDIENKGIVESIRYTAYGEEEVYGPKGKRVKDPVSPWHFCSKRVDKNTGWVFFDRRCYDPIIGRWTTPDPLFFEDGINRYAYVKNRPTLYIDPNGLKAVSSRGNPIVFKKYYAFEIPTSKKSGLHTIPGKHQPNLSIGFINGIWNTLENAKKSASALSKFAGGYQVDLCHNATHGTDTDLVEANMNLKGVCTTPVKYLHQKWNNFFAGCKGDGHYLEFCHSQGTAHVRNALETYDEDLRKNIRVVAIAPLAYIDPDVCEKVVHYVSEGDPVPLLDAKNKERVEETIVYLKPHENASWILDHEFLSDTYEEAQKKQIDDFFDAFGVCQ
ncbi:MAG: tRNA nuclease WapA [Chlamydiae bacterium]|nr:tRNA nuclease WapA [Chlamydiota bacterium]